MNDHSELFEKFYNNELTQSFIESLTGCDGVYPYNLKTVKSILHIRFINTINRGLDVNEAKIACLHWLMEQLENQLKKQ